MHEVAAREQRSDEADERLDAQGRLQRYEEASCCVRRHLDAMWAMPINCFARAGDKPIRVASKQ